MELRVIIGALSGLLRLLQLDNAPKMPRVNDSLENRPDDLSAANFLGSATLHLNLQSTVNPFWLFYSSLHALWAVQRGRRTVNVAPLFLPSLCASTVPPCSSTSSRTIERPRPRPCCSF